MNKHLAQHFKKQKIASNLVPPVMQKFQPTAKEIGLRLIYDKRVKGYFAVPKGYYKHISRSV